MSSQDESTTGWLSLDQGVKLHILSYLSTAELCRVATLSKEDKEAAAEPLIWRRKLASSFDLCVRGPVPSAYKDLFVGLARRKLGTSHQLSPHTTNYLRFEALFTDGGCDEDKYKQFWADLAFECNLWGAYCSKVPLNVHVLGLLQTPSNKEQEDIQHHAWLADRCKFAAGRMLARVPLPEIDQPLTPRQDRYFAKAGATLMRWSTFNLERLYCLLYANRGADPISRSLCLGEFREFSSSNTHTEASFYSEMEQEWLLDRYEKILHTRLGAEQAELMKSRNPMEVLQALTAAYNAMANTPNASEVGGSGGGGQNGGGIDLLDLSEDPHGLRVFNRKLAQKLVEPKGMASFTSVMDMIAISRAGYDHFTCPIQIGAVLLGSVTPQSAPAPAPGPRPPTFTPLSSIATLKERLALEHARDASARAHLTGIVGQHNCKALDDVVTAEAVFGAVAAGHLPRVLQYKQAPHCEYIEFACTTVERPRQRTEGEAPPSVPLQPVLWYRFFTRAEQEHLALIDRERIGKQAQRSSSTWASVTPNQRAAFKKHLIQQQQQQQQGGGQEAGPSSSTKKKGKQKKGAASQSASAPLTVPQQLAVMSAAGQLELVDVSRVLAPDVKVSMDQAAWVWSMMQGQKALALRQQQQQNEGEGGASEDSSAVESDELEDAVQQLQDAMDDDDAGVMGLEAPDNVNEMLAMMGYDEHPDAPQGDGSGSSSEESSSSDGSGADSDDDTSDTEGHTGGHAPESELAASQDPEDSSGEPSMMETDEDEADLEEDFVASQFPDIIDVEPPPVSERLLVMTLAGHVGMQLLINTHNELERESQLIVEQAMGLRAPQDASTSSVQKREPGQAGWRTERPNLAMHVLPGDQTAEDSTALHEPNNSASAHPHLLQARLLQPRSGNMVCVKLILPENRMEEMNDMHDERNVDIQFAAFRGCSVKLGQGLQMSANS